ncbi:lcor [Pungitius sinensis]
MASQCKSQQCTIDRRGFRQELDSWRHKLVHCVGFESILEGLFGPELVDDPTLFKDFEPTAVSDWSFDENCLFCCLRRDKVKEHLIGLSNKELEDSPKPLLIKDPTAISRLEKQAEEFLNAVLSRKDVPNFSDPHIPVVAREILHRMIRQFAAEYTSKTSSPQDSGSDSQPCFDQSLQPAPALSRADPPTSPSAPPLAGPAHNQNPVLSKLLMADQDAPLDLTIKRPPAVPRDQDGVLDLSIKKSRCSSTSSLPVRSPCLSPATSTLKGEPHDMPIAKARDLQSASSLEQFMAKLCPHHQRQIIDAIGFLQTEVKALASSKTQQASKPTSGIQVTACSTAKSNAASESSCAERLFPSLSTPKSEVQRTSRPIQSSCAMKQVPENAVMLKTSAGPVLDLRSPGSGSRHALVNPAAMEAESNCGGDHAPLKMKIMTSNVAAGKKLSCVLNTSLSSHSDSLEDRQGNSNPSHRTETHSARLSSSVKRHNQTSHAHQARPRDTLGPAKDKPASLFSVHMTIPSDSPRTARKTVKSSSDHRIRDSACRGIADPDLGHCDIVFIDKPITECFKEQRRGMQPRRNARKSTRGHMYSDEIWELKTVRTLAGRGKCPNPLPELITLVTPKQVLSKPEGLPPVNMPFAGACRESTNHRMSTEGLDESVIPGTGDAVEVAASDVDLPVETSQTDQSQGKEQSAPPSPIRPPKENKETDLNTDVEQNTTGDSGTSAEREESVAQAPFDAEQDDEPERQGGMRESNDRLVPDKVVEPLEDISVEEDEPQLSSVDVQSSETTLHLTTAPSAVAQVEKEKEESNQEQTQAVQPESPRHCNNSVSVEANTTGSAEEPMGRETEMKTSEGVEVVLPSENEGDNEEDVSSKTLDSLLKELPPWRRKKGTVVSLPQRLRKADAVVVGFVNGRPISASDRSLRRRSSHSTTSPNKTPVKSSRNVPNKNSVESTVDNRSSEKHLPESDRAVKSIESTSVIQQVHEPSSAIPPSPKSKSPPKNKQRKAPTGQDSFPVLSDQRQLRSASQRAAGAPPSPPKSYAGVSISSPQPTAEQDHPSTEQLHALPCPSPLPAASAPIGSSSPASSEKSQQQVVPETTESNTESAQPVETSFEEIQKTTVENQLQAEQKPQSAKIGVDDSRNEHPDRELLSPLENQSPSKAEMQSQPMPLRSKRVLLKEAEASDVALLQKPNVAFSESTSASGDEGSSLLSEKPKRMPLRSESSKVEMPHQSPAVNTKKSALRSQRPAVASTSAFALDETQSNVTSPPKIIPERVTKAQVKAPPVSVATVLPHSSATPVIPPKAEPPKPTNKFFQALTAEENQHLITNLNLKFDKMQKGWVQMDKEGQPAAKYKNKADRQAAIWKSKRRARKSKSSENQKYSPVQMLFMKGFNLSSICRWFLDTTETKSLVIVKKVNTRLPSETQLCFHSSSSSSGTSQGVFPSLQAERLKKHLKKFAIASPVKSNPRSQKLIAKALEHEAKERGEQPSSTQASTKALPSAKACAQMVESQKSSGKSKNPASARILRKYSNIREKMQVQQTNVRLKEASNSGGMKRLATKKSAAKSNLRPPLRAKESRLPGGKRMNASAAKMERRKTPKHTAERRAVRAPRDELPKRSSQRLGSPRTPDRGPPDAFRSKADNRKPTEAERTEGEKPAASKANATKEPPQSAPPEAKGPEGAAGPQPSGALEPPQVLTRAQRKMNVASKPAAKTQGPSRKTARRSEEPAMTTRRRPVASAPRAATKRARERSQTPAKRTRTSLSK